MEMLTVKNFVTNKKTISIHAREAIRENLIESRLRSFSAEFFED